MKIGIDATVLQTGHRMRGIGYTLINFINHMPGKIKQKHTFVFFMYSESDDNPIDILNVQGLQYEIRVIPHAKKSTLPLPGKLRIVNSLINALYKKKELLFGDSRIKELQDIDWFLQFDQSQAIPARGKVKSVLILYDLIQYIMEYDYLTGYRTARLKSHSRKGALRLSLRRHSYASALKRNARKAQKLVAISQHTKNDFVHILGINADTITVCHLGVSQLLSEAQKERPQLSAYRPTSWGDFPRPVILEEHSYLLFVGGADPRRKLSELVAAFNNLRARGNDIKLVLAGDTMLGPSKVPNVELQEYLKHTSYLDDIYFVGFVNDQQRDWLYKNAIAFVYPSLYEGFGLPILEAMQYGTPVVTYDNSSIKEISGDAALYTNDYLGIADTVTMLIHDAKLRRKYALAGPKQASKYTWPKMINKVLHLIEE